jgi:hypothetical protein
MPQYHYKMCKDVKPRLNKRYPSNKLEIMTLHLPGLCLQCSYSLSDCVVSSFQFLGNVELVDEEPAHP